MISGRSNVRLFGLLLLIALRAGVPTTAKADTLYSNPQDYPGSYDAFTSQNDGTNDFALFSSFQLSQNSVVNSISWQGLYVSSDLNANPPAPDSTSFSLSFYSSSGGTPGTFLGGETIGVGAGGVSESFVANDPNFFLGFTTQTTAAIYDYSVNLTTPFALSGGTTYFLSIVANTTNTVGLPYWAWMSGGANGPTYATYATGPLDSLSRTFALSGSAVPEPSSLLMLLAGVAAVSGLRRFAKNRVAPRGASAK
jgi:hypothetical protein